MPRGDRASADEVEVGGAWTMQAAGRVTTLFALAAALAAAMWQADAAGALAIAPMIALPVAWLGRVAVPASAQSTLIAALAALIAVQVEIFVHARLWLMLVLVIACADGRWLGATVGSLLTGGRRMRSTFRLTIGAMACGPTQLALTGLLLGSDLISEETALALVVGALVLESTTGMRRWMAGELRADEEA